METQWLVNIPHMTHTLQQVYIILQAFTSLPSQDKPVQPLFHAVSPMINKDGYVIQYLPQHCCQARSVLAIIHDLLPGLQVQTHPILHLTTEATCAEVRADFNSNSQTQYGSYQLNINHSHKVEQNIC